MSKTRYIEIGDMLQSPKKNADDPNEKPSYYIKLTASKEVLASLKEGTIVQLESPRVKYDRMIASGKLSPEKEASAVQQRDRIPKFVAKRLVAKIIG